MSNPSYNNSIPPSESTLSIENRNFLSPVGFKFIIDKLRGVDFFCQAANVPAMSMESADLHTRFNKLPQPGDEMYYEDLTLRFLVDENLKNYYQVADWMRELATPKTSKEFTYKRGELASQNPSRRDDYRNQLNQWMSDCSLFILSSNYQPVSEFIFKNAFPVSLTTLQFDSSVDKIQYFTAEVKIRYAYFDYYVYEAATATDASMQPDYRRSEEGVILPLG